MHQHERDTCAEEEFPDCGQEAGCAVSTSSFMCKHARQVES